MFFFEVSIEFCKSFPDRKVSRHAVLKDFLCWFCAGVGMGGRSNPWVGGCVLSPNPLLRIILSLSLYLPYVIPADTDYSARKRYRGLFRRGRGAFRSYLVVGGGLFVAT